MVLLPAALLALSVLPAVAVAVAAPFALPQTTDQCPTCAALVTNLQSCSVSDADLNNGLATSQLACLCGKPGFAGAAATCLTCSGTPTTEADVQSNCVAAVSSQSASSVSPSRTTTPTGSATRTSTSASQSTPLTPSESACIQSPQCLTFVLAYSNCAIPLDKGTLSDTEGTCVCQQSGFEDSQLNCVKCLNMDTTGLSTYCDAYVSSASKSASPKTIATPGSATTSSAIGTSPTPLSGSGLRTAAKTGDAVANNIPGAVVPVFVAALIYQLVWGF